MWYPHTLGRESPGPWEWGSGTKPSDTCWSSPLALKQEGEQKGSRRAKRTLAKPRTCGLGERRDAGDQILHPRSTRWRGPLGCGGTSTFLPGRLTDRCLPDGCLATACQAGSWDRGFSTSYPQAVTLRPHDSCQPQASLHFPSAALGCRDLPSASLTLLTAILLCLPLNDGGPDPSHS